MYHNTEGCAGRGACKLQLPENIIQVARKDMGRKETIVSTPAIPPPISSILFQRTVPALFAVLLTFLLLPLV
jgi:hypothetical protein